jgi:hypothetical protein
MPGLEACYRRNEGGDLMRHIQFVLIGSVIALLSVTNAHATVIYRWHSTSPGPYVTATSGELVFTNAAYFSGSIDFRVNALSGVDDTSPWIHYGDYPDNYRITNSPIISASLTFNLTDGGWIPGVSALPGSLDFSEWAYPFVGVFTFNANGTLTGDLFLYDESDQTNASGTHYSWSVFNYGSDYFGPEQCGPPTCDGGSGYWQLSSVSVREPPVWSLFVLGVLGILGLLSLPGLRRKA